MLPRIPLLLADACTNQGLLPDLYANLRNTDGSCEVVIDELNDLLRLVGNAVSILMIVAGFVAIAFIIVGGFTYITSSGDPSGIKKGRDIIINAVIGLILAMIAFGVVTFITGSF